MFSKNPQYPVNNEICEFQGIKNFTSPKSVKKTQTDTWQTSHLFTTELNAVSR